MEHNLMVVLAGLLALGVFCQWLAWRIKVPSILPLLTSGFLIGPVLGLVHPRELMGDLYFPVISLLVSVVLFEGALTLNLREVRNVAKPVRNLMTVGALITWAGGALAVRYIFNLDWSLSVLFGALVIVTGPTVIRPLLINVRPNQRIASILMWEGILIDPLGALLVVLVFDFIVGGTHGANPLLGFLQITLTGVSIGLVGGYLVMQILRRYLVPDYLRDATVLALVAVAFAVSDMFQSESGLLAVTVMGIFLANSDLTQLRSVLHFKEKLSVLFIAGLFILLAANIEMATIALLEWRSLALLAVMIFVIRPLSIQVSALGSDLSRNERLFLSWIAPRGIVAAAITSLFAFTLEQNGYGQARLLESLVFLIIVGTVILQGLTAKPFARFLGVAEADPQGFLIMGAHRFARMLAQAIQAEGFTVRLVDSNFNNVRAARMDGLDVYHGNILSEYTEDQVDLSGIGRLLALTSNDEANALACRHLEDEFGSSEVYQVVPRTLTENSNRSPSLGTLGRLLFTERATHQTLLEMVHEGATIKRTPLTEQFPYSSYREQYQERFIPLMAIRRKKVVLATIGETFEPQPGWLLLSLVEKEAAKPAAERQSQQMQPSVEPATAKH